MKISITRLLLHNGAQRRPIGISVLLRRPIGVWRYIGVWHCVGVWHSIGVWYSIGTERLFLDGGYQLRL